MNLGKKLINLRKQEKMTQEKFAEIIGVTRQTISNWELNITRPDLTQIEKISKLFRISIDEILDNDIQNIIVEKVNKTEKIVNKNTKTIKILIITIYILLLVSSLTIIIYYSTKKDFTKTYQTDIFCDTYYIDKISNEKIREKIKISLEYEENPNYIETGNQSIDNQMISVPFIVISYYNEYSKKYDTGDKYYAGQSFSDIFQSIHLIKEFMIEEYNAKCY